MFDEVQRLRDAPELANLLEHYAMAGSADREAWQDRLMQMDGVAPATLVHLHGELIAHGHIEQNTGVIPTFKPGVIASCYRITSAGLRALQDARRATAVVEREVETEAGPESPVPRKRKSRTTASASPSEVIGAVS